MKRIFCFLKIIIIASIFSVLFSSCDAEEITSNKQYRKRELITVNADTMPAGEGWKLLGKEYSDWQEWSDWSSTPSSPTMMRDVDVRESTNGQIEYRTRNRTYQYAWYRWGDWSEWTDELIVEYDNLQVETRIIPQLETSETAVSILDTSEMSMLAGTGTQLILPEDNDLIYWKSSNPFVASVNAAGYVSALSDGETTISVGHLPESAMKTLKLHVISEASHIPESTTIIEEEAFKDISIEALDLRNTQLNYIGEHAFSNNNNLKIILTENMTGSIADNAFLDSPNVTIAAKSEDHLYQFADQKGFAHYIFGNAETYVPVNEIQLNIYNITMNIGEATQLNALILPQNATTPYVSWASSSTSVQIDEYGFMEAVHEGDAIITAKSIDGEYQATCSVTVKDPSANNASITSISLSQNLINLTGGDTATLTATVAPINAADPAITWISKDPSIAYVIDGVVHADSAGCTFIYAMSKDNHSVFAACLVSVTVEVIPDTSSFVSLWSDGITTTDAVIHADVNPNVNPDVVGFYFGTDPNNLQLSAIEDTTHHGSTPLTKIWYNMNKWGQVLTEDTTYYYRFYMTFNDTTIFSEIKSFHTSAPQAEVEYHNDSPLYRDDYFNAVYVKDLSASSVTICAEIDVPDFFSVISCDIWAEGGEFFDYVEKDGDDFYGIHARENYLFTFTIPLDSRYERYGYRIRYSDESALYEYAYLEYDTPTLYFSVKNVGITVPEEFIYIKSGESLQLNPKGYTPSNATLTWESLDPSLLTVDNNGYITAVGEEGYAEIRVTASYGEKSATGTFSVDILPIVTVRFIGIGNVRYHSDSLYIDLMTGGPIGNRDPYGNDTTMGINAKALCSIYSITSFVGVRNASYYVDPGTNANLKAVIKNKLSGVKEDDLSIIYIGGHGKYVYDQHGKPVYFTKLTEDRFTQDQYNSLADEIKGMKIFIVDSCQSGQLVKYFRDLHRTDVCVLSASKIPDPNDLDKSDIRSMPGNKHTYLSYYYINGLGQYLPADKNKDNKVTITEICNYVKTNVVSATQNDELPQSPSFYIPENAKDLVIYQRDILNW